MKINIALVGALASLASAHSDPREAHTGIPKMMGARSLFSELKARNAMPAALDMPAVHSGHQHGRELPIEERQNADGTCGPNIGNCAANQCCSLEGYCGIGKDYCMSPDCQYQYGPACDANQKPAGDSTANIARPKFGSVDYGGTGIYDCAVPGDIAFTFDDGPYNYTSDLLDKLKVYNAKATFMITGNNLGKGAIDSTPQWANLIKRMVAEGHQVASHTWSHQDLSLVDATTFNNQIIYNEMAFRNILGYFPTYMRPPYSSCNDTCGARLADLGYHVTYFDLDTAGYLNDSPALIQNSKNIWDKAINAANNNTDAFLDIEHDIHYQTVYNLTDYILASMYKHGFKSVTVGDCLGDPAANWYRSGNASAPVPVVQSVSVDGSCSSTVTCLGSEFGNCCSPAGYCGSTTDYCGAGCQPDSGTCPSSTSTSSSSTPTSTSAAISTDGSCSSTVSCQGSEFGNCCSQNGYCGSTTDYCGAGCQPAFGSCGVSSSSRSSVATTLSTAKAPTTSSTTKAPTTTTKALTTTTSKAPTSTSTKSAATPTPALKTSPNGLCGGKTGYTCTGYRFGGCCSALGRCGPSIPFWQMYCGVGCQKGFGSCN